MTDELDIDIRHDDVGLEAFEHADLDGHVALGLRNDENSRLICLTLPEVAVLCQGLREWMARKGVNDAQIENVSLRHNEENPLRKDDER